MGTGKMHAGEVHIDAALVGCLIAEQFPRWAGLPIRAGPFDGNGEPSTGSETTSARACHA